MSTASSKTWLAVRFIFCGIAAFLSAMTVGFQGNGNLLPSGVLIGLVLGMAWSVSLCFGLPALVRDFRPTVTVVFFGVLLVAALILIPIICFHLWGHAVEFHPWSNNSLQPTPVGHFSSAFAVDITHPAWLSLVR
jgi:hypothetical protein